MQSKGMRLHSLFTRSTQERPEVLQMFQLGHALKPGFAPRATQSSS